MNYHCLVVYVPTICCDLFTQLFQSCRERRQLFVCGQRTGEFIKPFPNKGIIFDYIQLALTTGVTK